jgi:hypothetical protein
MSLPSVAQIVAGRLRQKNFTNAQIAGILGNFSQESSLNPRINEGGKVGAPLGVGGFGLAQWTGGRQNALVNFAKQRKMDPGDPALQADFLVYELEGPEKRAAESLRQAKSPEQAALVFRRDYERAGIPKDERRMQAARGFLPKLEAYGAEPQAADSQSQTASLLLDAFKKGLMGQTLGSGMASTIPSFATAMQNTSVPMDIGVYQLAPRSPYLDALSTLE